MCIMYIINTVCGVCVCVRVCVCVCACEISLQTQRRHCCSPGGAVPATDAVDQHPAVDAVRAFRQ